MKQETCRNELLKMVIGSGAMILLCLSVGLFPIFSGGPLSVHKSAVFPFGRPDPWRHPWEREQLQFSICRWTKPQNPARPIKLQGWMERSNQQSTGTGGSHSWCGHFISDSCTAPDWLFCVRASSIVRHYLGRSLNFHSFDKISDKTFDRRLGHNLVGATGHQHFGGRVGSIRCVT